MSKMLTIGITQGDSNGIGYEVIIKALADPRILDMFIPVVYGSSKMFGFNKKLIPEAEQMNTNVIGAVADAKAKRVNIINCVPDSYNIEFGQVTKEGAAAAYASLKAAVEDLKSGAIDALVTAPFNKHSMEESGFAFPGHTEYLQSQFPGGKSLMFMCSERLKVGVATNHTPIARVSEMLTSDLIVSKLEIMNASLKSDFCIEKPKIAVLGLNPHAGDEGSLGREEIEIIAPAVEAANQAGIMTFGPFSPDGFFGNGQYQKFDAVLAMYHDQGLIPFKTLAFDEGVNYTAGLPVVRTSPDHGTGYDIAGKNLANPRSMLYALFMAADICKHRQVYEEITANPLQIKVFETKNAPDRSYLPE
jgi:4-hydroxythreonine-4-phosphate dehydrogenase